MKGIIEALRKKTRMRTKFLVVTTMIVGIFVGLSLYKNIVFHKNVFCSFRSYELKVKNLITLFTSSKK